MDSSRAIAALALVALLLLAGCQAPGTPQTGEFAPNVTVVNETGAERGTTIDVAGNATVDPGAVFTEVQALLNSDVPPPPNVRVLDDPGNVSGARPTFQSPVRRYLNVTARGDVDLDDQVGGAVGALGTITIYPGERRDPQATTWVLAHELTHYVQVRSGVFDRLRKDIDVGTTDGSFVYRAMLEGPAVYTTEAYIDEYLPKANTTLDLYRSIDEGLPPGSAGTYANRQYLVGYRYVRSQVDSPAGIAALYNDTARTSEQLIHGYDPSAEPMTDLAVEFDGGEEWTVTGRDRLGEAFLWTALEDRLGTQRARAAAAGWGNDSLLTVYPTDEGNASFAWVIDWDDAANATEFARDAREYLDRAGTSEGELTHLQSDAFADVRAVGDRTTVLFIGDREFVAGANVDATGDGVTVSVDG